MILAGHYPTQHFTVAELAAMHVYERDCQRFSEIGWNRSTDSRGKPLVFYAPGVDDPKPHCIVRPVVRVKAPTSRLITNGPFAGMNEAEALDLVMGGY
jgi:hypothetical protein